MTDDEKKMMFADDRQMSEDLGVPSRLYERSPDFIDWYGRFAVQINGREFKVAVTPSSLFVNEADASAPVAMLASSGWLDSPMGPLFHANYMTPLVNGGFQLFRKAGSSPFEGFESVEHSHMLVYTNGAGEKQFFPVVIEFASE